MNDLLEAKLIISRIKTKMLDLTGELIADNITDKAYAINRLLEIIDYVDKEDIRVAEIIKTIAK